MNERRKGGGKDEWIKERKDENKSKDGWMKERKDKLKKERMNKSKWIQGWNINERKDG